MKGKIVSDDGDTLPLAHVTVLPDSITITTSNSGQFSIRLHAGEKSFHVSYVGYEVLMQNFSLKRDTTLSFTLKSKTKELNEVVISSDRNLQEEVFESNRTSTHIITKDHIPCVSPRLPTRRHRGCLSFQR